MSSFSRKIRRNLGYCRGFLTPQGAAALGVDIGEVHFLPSKPTSRFDAVLAEHIYRSGTRIGGGLGLGESGVIPLAKGVHVRVEKV